LRRPARFGTAPADEQTTVRIALGIEYDGRAFHGWQSQDALRNVQDVVQAALSRVADRPVRVQCAGRTDAGVHARGQVAHFDTDAVRSPRSWVLGTNSHLADDVSLLWAAAVADDFHARFSAVRRSYRYLILNRGSRPALLHGRATWIHRPLDAEAMHRAGQALVGTHDFSSYRAVACQAKSPVRSLHSLDVLRRGDLVELHVTANAFLHHMVRNIAGVLIAVGKGDAGLVWPAEVLALRDRTLGGVTAPPDGLYFEAVDYPPQFGVPPAGLHARAG
jgi:tRNA pseudouridine38-40 synthase